MTEPSPAQTGGESSTPAACTFRLTFLGKQALNRPTNNTGFGSVQKPLRDIYLAAGLQTGKEPKTDRAAERTFVFDGNAMQIRFWDATARRFQQESWPLDCVTYLDLVLFQTVKGRKRHFGYFRRHTDPTDVVPDAVLIPLHKRDFLECHAYQVEDEATGRQFIDQFDRCSADKARTEHRSERKPLFNYAPWQPAEDRAGRSADAADGNLASISKWASQPALAPAPSATAAAPRRDLSAQKQQQQEQQPEDRRYKSSGNLGISLMPATDGSFVVVDSLLMTTTSTADTTSQQSSSPSSSVSSASAVQRHHQQQQASLSSGAIQRSASGTIFEKYKELQAFNIPECEYMGFQEMQQQLENRRQQRLTHSSSHHRQQPHIQQGHPSSSRHWLDPIGLAASAVKMTVRRGVEVRWPRTRKLEFRPLCWALTLVDLVAGSPTCPLHTHARRGGAAPCPMDPLNQVTSGAGINNNNNSSSQQQQQRRQQQQQQQQTPTSHRSQQSHHVIQRRTPSSNRGAAAALVPCPIRAAADARQCRDTCSSLSSSFNAANWRG
uniref:IRS-type PTB domain-containing protein n=1 Tax=Macrostomum lignano TaxID=282301 RepID=A0A1I8F592_9PLAT